MLLINCKNHVDKINRELDGQEIVSVTVLPQYTYLWDSKNFFNKMFNVTKTKIFFFNIFL